MSNCVVNKIRRDVACKNVDDLCRGRSPFAVWSLERGEGGGEAKAYATPLGVYFDISLWGIGDGVYVASLGSIAIAHLYARGGRAHLGTLTAKIPASMCTRCTLDVNRVS